MGIPDHLICLLRNLYADQEEKNRTGHGTTGWFQLGKEYIKAILSSCLFNFYAGYIMWNAMLNESQVGIKTSGRNINNLRYANDHSNGRNQRGTREPLDKGDRGEWKGWLKTQHSKY